MRRYLQLALTICLLTVHLPAYAGDAEDLLPKTNEPATDSVPEKPAAPAADPTAAPSSSATNLTVDDVKIEGNRLVPSEDILKVVKTKRGDKYDRDQVFQDLKAINGIGYFDEQKMQGTPELTKDGVLLKIRVQENAPVTEFSIQGNNVVSTEEISKLFSDQLGKPQNLTALSSAIDKVEKAYHDKGYILAKVTDVKDDPDGSIGLSINEGVIDGIQIVGNKKTQDYVIRRRIKIQPGTIYNEKQLTADLRKLYGEGYFQDIRRSLAPSANNPDKYTLKVEVDEKRTGSVSLGAGVDTMAGPFGTAGFSENNFLGKGQILSFHGMVGSGMYGQLSNTLNNAGTNFLSNQRTYQLEASWIDPSIAGTNTSMAVTGFGRTMNSMLVDQSQQQTIGASVNFSHPLTDTISANLGFTGENVMMKDLASYYTNQDILTTMGIRALETGRATTIAGAESLAQNVRNQQLKGGLYASINPSLAYDTRDKKLDPTSGTVARLTASPSLGITNGSFMKAGASVSKFVPITKETTLAMNVQGGAGLGAVPAFGNYMLGGFNGMRGYRSFSDLGTGTSMLMASAEVRHRIPGLKNMDSSVARAIDKHVKLDAFFDAGQVGGNSLANSLTSRSTMGASVGFGVRVQVPMIGLIRLDVGLPLIQTLMGGMTPRFTVGFGDKF